MASRLRSRGLQLTLAEADLSVYTRSRPMIALLVVIFLFAALLGYLIGIYNGLVRVSAAVKLAWSNIDVLLIQRHDEIPKLVEVCKQYMQYEAGTLERVMKARTGVDA